MTPLRRWRARRNLIICLAFSRGAPQELLADVFDLSQPTISRIVEGVSLRTYRKDEWAALIRLYPIDESPIP